MLAVHQPAAFMCDVVTCAAGRATRWMLENILTGDGAVATVVDTFAGGGGGCGGCYRHHSHSATQFAPIKLFTTQPKTPFKPTPIKRTPIDPSLMLCRQRGAPAITRWCRRLADAGSAAPLPPKQNPQPLLYPPASHQPPPPTPSLMRL
jgi:hypothetical protein